MAIFCINMEEEAANDAAILERRHEIRRSLKAVESSLREAGAVTDGYNSAYLLESPTAHWDHLPSHSLFQQRTEAVSSPNLARCAAFRFDFDPPDAVRHEWKVSPLGKAKCHKIWTLFDADEDQVWTYEEFQEYMATLKDSGHSMEMRAFVESAEVWAMYMSDICELDEEGRLTFEGFVMYRELIEDERPLARDLKLLGISLQWEELEKLEKMKLLFDDYVDDSTGLLTTEATQYLLAAIGFNLTSDETIEIIQRMYQHARCMKLIQQLKRTLRLFGYRQKSTLRFFMKEAPVRSGSQEEQPRVCKAGFLCLLFSSWCPAVKARWRKFFLQCRLQSFCALKRLKRQVGSVCSHVKRAASTGLLSASCLMSRTFGTDRGDYMVKVDIGPRFSTAATIHLTYNSDADSATTLHELKYLERGAECFLYVDITCRSGTKESDAQLLVDRLTWFIGEFFRDHIESLPFFHRWFVTLPTKPQLRMGPTSNAAGSSSTVVRLVILFTGEMDLYHVMQSLNLPSSMQFDHLLQRFSVRWLCSHSLEDLLVLKNLNLGSQWSCRTQVDLRLNRQAWAQILSQIAHQLEAALAHERGDAEYIAQVKVERELEKQKSVAPNVRRRESTATQENRNLQHTQDESSKTESREHVLIKSLRRVAYALEHSQQFSSMLAFPNLGTTLRENPWFRTVLSPQWYELLTHVLETPGGLSHEWKAKGDSFRAEFADTSYALAGVARQMLGRRPSKLTGSSTEFTLAPLAAAAKNLPTSRSSETPKLTARRSHLPSEMQKLSARSSHEPNHSTSETFEEKSTEYLLLEFYDLCARHLQGVHVVRAEAGTSGVTCIFEGWNFFSLLPRIHQGHLAKKASLVRSGTFSSRQPISSRSVTSGMPH